MKQLPAHSRPSRTEPDTAKGRAAADVLPLKQLTIYTDGASRGNPGEAGAGIVIDHFTETGRTAEEIAQEIAKTGKPVEAINLRRPPSQ